MTGGNKEFIVSQETSVSGAKQHAVHLRVLSQGDTSVPVVKSCKLLGITVSNDLSRQHHVKLIERILR